MNHCVSKALGAILFLKFPTYNNHVCIFSSCTISFVVSFSDVQQWVLYSVFEYLLHCVEHWRHSDQMHGPVLMISVTIQLTFGANVLKGGILCIGGVKSRFTVVSTENRVYSCNIFIKFCIISHGNNYKPPFATPSSMIWVCAIRRNKINFLGFTNVFLREATDILSKMYQNLWNGKNIWGERTASLFNKAERNVFIYDGGVIIS